MIELDEFIAETLTSIVRGIKLGQESEFGDHVAPLLQGEKRNDHGNFHLKGDDSNQATIVQFDVQVTSELGSEGSSSGGGRLRLYVLSADVKGGEKTLSKYSNLHRLQFAIPVKIPRCQEKVTI